MIKGGTKFYIALILLLLASGCTPAKMSEMEVFGSRPFDGSEPTAVSTPVDTPDKAAPVETAAAEPAQTAVSTPTDTPEQGAPTATAAVDPGPTSEGGMPEDTFEGVSTADAAQIYAAAIRQMYSVNFSFGGPGETPEFPLVYIVSTTDDGTLLMAPATPPQEIKPELRQAIEAELADMLFEIFWVESLKDAPLDDSNGTIAEGQGIVITLGNILPQEDGTVHLPFYMLCGTLCLSGKTYVLEMVNNTWEVTGSVGVEVQG